MNCAGPALRKSRAAESEWLTAPHIAIRDIQEIRTFDLSRWGSRLRLVGLGFERPRTWFTWDPDRRAKRSAVELDTGRWFRIGLTPDDPEAFLTALETHPARAVHR